MKTSDAVSPAVAGGEVLASLLIFTLVYGALMVADIYLLAKYSRVPATAETVPPMARPAF
jgi:cytochrome d ubiquinol oxidase subunit I